MLTLLVEFNCIIPVLVDHAVCPIRDWVWDLYKSHTKIVEVVNRNHRVRPRRVYFYTNKTIVGFGVVKCCKNVRLSDVDLDALLTHLHTGTGIAPDVMKTFITSPSITLLYFKRVSVFQQPLPWKYSTPQGGLRFNGIPSEVILRKRAVIDQFDCEHGVYSTWGRYISNEHVLMHNITVCVCFCCAFLFVLVVMPDLSQSSSITSSQGNGFTSIPRAIFKGSHL